MLACANVFPRRTAAARVRDFLLHKQWMVRCYALTLAAVSLRLELPVLQIGLGLSFEASYAVVAWFSWVPNLVIAEWFFNQRPLRRALPDV